MKTTAKDPPAYSPDTATPHRSSLIWVPKDSSPRSEASLQPYEARLARSVARSDRIREYRRLLASHGVVARSRASHEREDSGGVTEDYAATTIQSVLRGHRSRNNETFLCFMCSESYGASELSAHQEGCVEITNRAIRALCMIPKEVVAEPPGPVPQHGVATEEEKESYAARAVQAAKALLLPCRHCKSRLHVTKLLMHERYCWMGS